MPNPRLPRCFRGVGARIPKVWANARTACPDALSGSGARGVGLFMVLKTTAFLGINAPKIKLTILVIK
jgi:hypothetical protein